MNRENTPRILLVIPAFKESLRLPKFITVLAEEISQSFLNIEVLLVDDGSGKAEQDSVLKITSGLRGKFEFILPPLMLAKNQGKGGAILAGWDLGTGYDYLGFVDADGAVSAREVIRVASTLKMRKPHRAIFASRIKMLGKKITRGWRRHLSGRVFSFIVGIMLDPEVYDSQCGLKFVPQEVYLSFRKHLKGRRFAFDVELLAAIRSGGHEVVEVPIDWDDIEGSKVAMVRDTIRMILAVFQIRREIRTWM